MIPERNATIASQSVKCLLKVIAEGKNLFVKSQSSLQMTFFIAIFIQKQVRWSPTNNQMIFCLLL